MHHDVLFSDFLGQLEFLEWVADAHHFAGGTGEHGRVAFELRADAGEDDAFQLPPIEELLGGKLDCIPPEEIYLKPVPKRQRTAEEKAASDANEAEQAAAAAANRKRSSNRRDGRRDRR